MKVPSSLISGTVKSSSYFNSAIGQETLDDLENDDSYINTASRFLQSLG